MFVIVRDSTVLGRVIYEGGTLWSAYHPGGGYRCYEHRSEAEATACGLGHGARVERADVALAYQDAASAKTMTTYRVTWTTDVEAETSMEAAQIARDMTATVFDVTRTYRNTAGVLISLDATRVDLLGDEPGAHSYAADLKAMAAKNAGGRAAAELLSAAESSPSDAARDRAALDAVLNYLADVPTQEPEQPEFDGSTEAAEAFGAECARWEMAEDLRRLLLNAPGVLNKLGRL